MSIKNNLTHIQSTLNESVKLIAVSKTKPIEMIQEAYDAGQRIFGENKALELAAKYDSLPKDIQWHFIGHLQTNKVKYIAPFVSLIHSVDSIRLLCEIDKQGNKHNRIIDCLLQFHIALEDTKFGLSLDEAYALLNDDCFKNLNNIRIVGVMGMATFTDDREKIRTEFKQLKHYFNQLKSSFFNQNNDFNEISMGMSDDYLIAIEEGSTFVRIGSSIFGERNYL